MLRRGAARPGQVLPHQLLQMPCMPEFSGPGRVLLQRRRLLLHQRLPGPFRHQMLSLRTVRRGGSGHRSGEDVPQQLFHLRPLQVIAVFFFVNQPAEKELFFYYYYNNNNPHSIVGRTCVAIPVECAHRGLWLDAAHFFLFLFFLHCEALFVITSLFPPVAFEGKQLKGSGQLCRITFAVFGKYRRLPFSLPG